MACTMPWLAQSQCFPKQYIDPLYGVSQNAAIQYGAADPYDILGLPINQNLFLICIRQLGHLLIDLPLSSLLVEDLLLAQEISQTFRD